MSIPPICHYFAYGSNMNAARVARRGLRVLDARAGRLDGFELTFNKMSRQHTGMGHANIEQCRGSRIEGVLYELADSQEIIKMDPFERAPWNYGRDAVCIDNEHGATWAWTYFANPAVLRAGLNPPLEYLEHLLAGREFLSEKYITALLAWRRSTEVV